MGGDEIHAEYGARNTIDYVPGVDEVFFDRAPEAVSTNCETSHPLRIALGKLRLVVADQAARRVFSGPG